MKRITEAGGRAVGVGADVSRGEDVIRLFDETVRAFGRIDIVVANSRLQRDAPVADMTLKDWRAVIDVDITGQFLCCREAVCRFRAQPGDGRPALD